MKKITLAAFVATVAVITFTSTAFADAGVAEQTQKQRLDQELEIKCETGSYGQSSTCYAKGTQSAEQEQRQRIIANNTIYRNGRKIHIPVDTAMDMPTTALIMAVAFIGLGAAVLIRKVA